MAQFWGNDFGVEGLGVLGRVGDYSPLKRSTKMPRSSFEFTVVYCLAQSVESLWESSGSCWARILLSPMGGPVCFLDYPALAYSAHVQKRGSNCRKQAGETALEMSEHGCLQIFLLERTLITLMQHHDFSLVGTSEDLSYGMDTGPHMQRLPNCIIAPFRR